MEIRSKVAGRGEAASLAQAVLATELVDATAGVDDLLLAREERVAVGADLGIDPGVALLGAFVVGILLGALVCAIPLTLRIGRLRTRNALLDSEVRNQQELEAEREDLLRVMREMRVDGRSPRSMARLVVAVRGFFTWLVAEGRLDEDPSAHLDAPKAWKSLPKVLDAADAVREALIGLGEYRRAVTELESVLAANDRPEARAQLARTLSKMGRSQAARAELEKIEPSGDSLDPGAAEGLVTEIEDYLRYNG